MPNCWTLASPQILFALSLTIQQYKPFCTKSSDWMRISCHFLFWCCLLRRSYNGGGERRIQCWIQSWIAGEQVQNSGTVDACEIMTWKEIPKKVQVSDCHGQGEGICISSPVFAVCAHQWRPHHRCLQCLKSGERPEPWLPTPSWSFLLPPNGRRNNLLE